MAVKKKWVNKGKDARTDFRVGMQISVRYRIARRAKGVWQMSPYFKGIGVDFSASGSGFIVAKDLPAGFLVYMEMYFPFERFPVSAVGEIVRSKAETFKGKAVFKCMIKYLLISASIQDKMVSYLNQIARGK